MPLLATFIGNLFAGLLGVLGAYFTKRAAGAIAVMALAATAAGLCWVGLSAVIALLYFAIPQEVFIPATWIVPEHFLLCVKSMIVTEGSIAAYRWTKNVAISTASAAQ